MRDVVQVGARLEDVVHASPEEHVLIVAPEVLAIGVEPALAVASACADARQDAVAQVLVFVELRRVLRALVVIDAADRRRTLDPHRVVAGLGERRRGGEQGGDEAGKQLLGHGCLPASPREELAATARRVRPVDRVVAVQAGPRNETRVHVRVRLPGLAGAGRVRVAGGAQPAAGRAVDRSRVSRGVVAVLAKVRRLLVQQLGMHRAVRVVAGRAVLLDRRMAEHERAALVRMA